MKIGSNFDSKFYAQSKKHNQTKYGENFFVTRFHIVKFLNNYSLHFFITISLCIGIILLFIYQEKKYIPYLTIVIGLIVFRIWYGYIKYRNSFIIMNEDEVCIYNQKTLFDREVNLILVKNIRNIDIESPKLLGTFLCFGTLKISNEGDNEPKKLPYFPNIQKNQFLVRKYILHNK